MKTSLNIEESKRLIKLGIDPDMASKEVIENIYQAEYSDPIPVAFTLEDLLRILPKKITDRQRIYELRIWIDHYSDNWCIEYVHDSLCNDFDDSFVSAEELIDAVYQEIVFLKTDGIKEV